MKLKRLWLDGFKNFNKFELDFTNQDGVMVLIGNNGSGKSNVLEAISAIFKTLYSNERVDFDYELEYLLDDVFIRVAYKQSTSPKSYKFYKNNTPASLADVQELLPAQVIALYSGEEERLWEEYYKEFYTSYNTAVINQKTTVDINPQMIYINKFYWDIALLTMIASNINISDIIGDIKLTSVSIEVDLENLSEFRETKLNDVVLFVDKLYLDGNGKKVEETETVIINSDELQRKFDAEAYRRLFNMLCVAILPKNKKDKLIKSIKLNFDNGVSTEGLSEGTKKRILIKLITTVLAGNNALLLLDEPDSHIHVANKVHIKQLLQDYQHLEILLTTHSPTLMNVFDRHLVFLENGEVKGYEKAEILKEISGDTMSDVQRQIVLNSNSDILIVEGKTDEKYITAALKKLKEEHREFEELQFNFLYLGGSDSENLRKIVERFKPRENQTIIAFFDNDNSGFKCIKNAYNYTMEKQNFTREIKNGIHLCLYPKKDGFTQDSFEIEDYFKIETCRDFMYDNFTTFQDTKKKFKKNDFAEHCVSLDPSEFEGFKKLFDLIVEIKNDG